MKNNGLLGAIAQMVTKTNDFGWLKKNFGNSKEVVELIKFVKIWQPQDAVSFIKVADLLENENGLSFVSACCFHATESRNDLVANLSPVLIDLIVETATTVIDPTKTKEWLIYTFSHGDSPFINEIGLKDVLLPFMKDIDNNQLEVLLYRQYVLTEQLAEKLRKRGFPVVLKSLADLVNKLPAEIDTKDLLIEAQARGIIMGKRFSENKIPLPKIFQMLSADEQVVRCAKEAFIYLLLTAAHLESIYLGLEVHGGYWRAGDLNQINGNLLPLCWPHPVVNQHWGHWAEQQKLGLINNQLKFLEKIKIAF